MEWVLILGLGVWVWLQSQRIGDLTRRLGELERRAGAPAPAVAGQPVVAERAQRPAPILEPLLLDTPLDPDELLLDTPLPDASNDAEPVAPTPPPPPPATVTPLRAPPPPRAAPNRNLEKWLAENGLAWLGGGAFALGAIYLVSVAAQQNWFTPQVQLACALALGTLLIGASEWARRVSISKPPGHPLIAALLAGAGVVAFYVTAWAAHGLYNFIDWGTTAALLAACAALLIALAFLHGEALGVLAIAAALLAPPLTHAPQWPDAALTLYVFAVGAAGFVLATLRRWPWTAVATIAGLYFWFAAAIATDDVRRALALLSCASMGGILLAFRPHLPADDARGVSWRRVHAWLPGIAITISSVLLIWTWLAISPTPSGLIAGPAWVGAMFVALAAAAVRARVAAPPTFAVSVGALVAGFVLYLRSRGFYGPLGADFYPAILFASFWITGSALGARPHRSARMLTAIAGAGGAAILTLLAASSRPEWHNLSAWAPLFTGAAILFGAAWHLSRSAQDAHADNAVDIWAGAGAVLALIGIESAFPAETRTAAHAGAALLFAIGLNWRGWRILGHVALTAAVLSIAHALSPDMFGAALSGAIPLWGALVILGASAALLFGASYFASRDASRPNTGEALSSAAILILLIAALLLLRWFASGGAGAPLDHFSEISLRVLTLIAAGHIVLPRTGRETGRIAQWRGHALMGAGLLYALFIPALAINPWWGEPTQAAIIGPPILNTLLLAFAAPAALACTAAYRLYNHQRIAARCYAIAGAVLALTWAVLELRRLFHGAQMANAPVGPFEAACYALVLLGFALTVALVARMREAKDAERPFTHDLIAVMHGTAWVGIVASAWIMLVERHPWWGGQDWAVTDALSTGLATLAQAAAVALALVLGRALSRTPGTDRTRFAAATAAIVFAWSFGHAAIRWGFHMGEMDDPIAIMNLEGFAHALWPLALVLIGAELTARAPGRDTVRSYLYDLQAIWATAVWTALGFAALGLWVLFNPWWGMSPATKGVEASSAPAGYVLAAGLSAAALRVPRVRWPLWFKRTTTVLVLAHLLVGLTLLVRRVYHGAAMASAPVTDLELWTYSAVWALFGGAVFWLGMRRADATLRWSGLSVLFGAAAYVFFLAFTRLTGFVQAGSMLGLATVLLIVAWFARTYRAPSPEDLINVTPGVRRERRRARR